MQKKGVYFCGTMGLTWRTELTWRAGISRMRHGTQGHVVQPREPTWRLGGARWCGHVARATRVHSYAREGRHVASEGLACEGPTG